MKTEPRTNHKAASSQARIPNLVLALAVATGVAGLAAGCASNKGGEDQKEEEAVRVTLAELSGPARATVDKVTAGGQVEKIAKEIEKGKTVYDVEATVDGKHLEFLIAEADGVVLGTEVPIEFSDLPEAVRAEAEKYFGSAIGLKVWKGIEYGQTTYEIEGSKKGKTVEATFDPTGKRVE